jgi:hypothetical protein
MQGPEGDKVYCRAADLRTHAPAFEGLAPRDNHYRLYGLADLTDEPHPFLSLEQARCLASLTSVAPA